MKSDRSATEIVTARVSPREHDDLLRVARTADRTPSTEVRRAIRFYLAHVELADRFLREPAWEPR